jgi:hypothetical protein
MEKVFQLPSVLKEKIDVKPELAYTGKGKKRDKRISYMRDYYWLLYCSVLL